MIKFCNYNIILPKHFEIVKKEGKPAEKIAVGSEGEAEGGCGGNSASPEPKRSPAALLVQSRSQQKSFLFLLPARRSLGAGGEEKIGRTQNQKCRENFFAGWRVLASGGGTERQNSQSGFSRKKVRILFRTDSKDHVLIFLIFFLRIFPNSP